MKTMSMLAVALTATASIAAVDGLPPFRIDYEVPTGGLSAIVVDDSQGVRVKNVEAEVPRTAGRAQVVWDLKDEDGNYVEPGTYRFKTLVMPRPELYYRHTVSPNVENFWDDRVPWSTTPSGPHGWGSDFGGMSAIATSGDRVYFGSGCAEAGQAFTEIDLDGKKHWGYHWFGPWIGLRYLATGEDAVYVIDMQDSLWRMTAEPKNAMKKIMALNTETRRGYANALAARNGELFISFAPRRIITSGQDHDGSPSVSAIEADLFDNATLEDNIDADNCLPLYSKDPPVERLKPDPRRYFLRLLRLPVDWSEQNRYGTPPGMYGKKDPRRFEALWPSYLQTPPGTARRQHLVVAFKQESSLGSLAFPYPVDPESFAGVEFSVLKPDAPYPPRPDVEGDWMPFGSNGKPGAWNVVAAPAGTRTRALRATFSRADAASDSEWVGWMEGMKMLNRRFVNHALDAAIRVNSGSVDASGVWDAQREEPVTRENPGVYVMEWKDARKISGLAIQEIDGAITEIDVWDGPTGTPVSLEDGRHWRHVAVYRQARRDHYGATVNHVYNAAARYLDGYVDIRDDGRTPVSTRAIRLRVVEQWLHPGMRGTMGVRDDRGGRALDTRRCRVFGIAAVEHIGGESVDERMYERLAVYDAATGKPLREFPFSVAERSLHFHPDGRLMALNASHDKLLAIDTATGATTELMGFSQPPQQIALGPDGNVYAFAGDTHRATWHERDFSPMGGHRNLKWPVRDPAEAPFRVYDLSGRLVKTIGAPGRVESGLWNPARVGRLNDMVLDRRGALWAATADPHKRIVRFDAETGEVTGEFFGNTSYGGGGSFNRYDASRVFLDAAQFKIDDETNRSRMFSHMGPPGGRFVAVRVNGRTYLADAPLNLGKSPGYVGIHLYDEETGVARRVAAFGAAVDFPPVRQGNILSKLGGQAPLGFSFTWSDLNGNGEVDPEEIAFEPVDMTPRWAHQGPRGLEIGFIDDQLGAVARNAEYVVTEFLPNGVPRYERRARPFSANFRFNDGNYLILQSDRDGRLENYAVDAEGRRIWGYPVQEPGVTGLNLSANEPGRIVNQFGNIIGHGVSEEGELGEFFITNHNTGQWRIWTSDGLLAGEIFQHKFFPGVRFFTSLDDVHPGMRLDPLSLNQEHFNGYFAKCEKSGRYYAVAGFTFAGMVEVRGFERARRASKTFQVTAEDIAQAKAWDAAQAEVAAVVEARAMAAHRLDAPPTLDGSLQAGEWPAATNGSDGRIALRVGYDKQNLHLCYTAEDMGVIANAGEDFRTCYTEGAAFDLFLGTDPNASVGRREPEAGDLRLLITFVEDQPRVVLFQPRAPSAAPGERWQAYSPAAGELAFDRVVVLDDAIVAKAQDGRRTVVEATVPLGALGLKIADGMKLPMDWGMLVSTDGRTVQRRVYWANPWASGTGDVVAEGRFAPHAWGRIAFEGPE